MTEQTPHTVASMVRDQIAQGRTQAELASMIGRDPKMIRKILRGETPGEAYREAFTELATRGKVTHKPPRRRGKDGHVVPVRAASGATVVPQDPAAKIPGRFDETIVALAGKARSYQYDMPRGHDTKGRTEANMRIRERLLNAARGQGKGGPKRTKMKLTLVSGTGAARKTTTVTVGTKGGYSLSGMRDLIKKADSEQGDGWDVMDWMKTQVGARPGKSDPPNLDDPNTVIVNCEITIY